MGYIDEIHALLPDNNGGEITANVLRQTFDILNERKVQMSGSTSQRPQNAETGFTYFDTDLNVITVWTGTAWTIPDNLIDGGSFL